MIELMVAMGVMVTLLVALAMTMNGFGRLNRNLLTRQRCIAAAQAQLNSIAATGKTLSEQRLGELWPDVNVAVEKSAGTRQWQGLQLVEATAVGRSYNRTVEIKLARYMKLKARE